MRVKKCENGSISNPVAMALRYGVPPEPPIKKKMLVVKAETIIKDETPEGQHSP